MHNSIRLFLIGLTISTTACSQKGIDNKTEKSYSYLALGDSYTICESVPSEQQWPKLLAQRLRQNDCDITETKIIARTGWRTDDLMQAANAELKSKKYDLVSLLIGVNNEFQGKSVASFETEFETCLDYAITHCSVGKAGVFVLSIPDYGFTPYGESNRASISPRIDAYNEVCERISKEKDVTFFNITNISRKGLENETLVTYDNLHPSATQYEQWVEKIFQGVKKLITP